MRNTITPARNSPPPVLINDMLNTNVIFAPMRYFWKRQFAPTATRGQRLFDFFFGVVTPWICVFLDPTVFRTEFGNGTAILAKFQIFSYTEIAFATAALAYFLFARRSSPVLAGFFFVGALFSFAVGVAILPLAVVALIIFIGALGLTPLVTAFVYLRNGIRAWRHYRSSPANPPSSCARSLSLRHAAAVAVLGAALMIGVPALFQVYVVRTTNSALATIESGSDSDSLRAIGTLKHLRFVFNSDDLAFAYERAQNPARRERLSRAFRALTGKDVHDRLAILRD